MDSPNVASEGGIQWVKGFGIFGFPYQQLSSLQGERYLTCGILYLKGNEATSLSTSARNMIIAFGFDS